MSNVILRLKTELISAHAITGIESINPDLYPNSENPFVELSAEQANDVLASGFGHVFEVVTELGNIAQPDKAALAAQYLAIVGSKADKRLSVADLIAAIADVPLATVEVATNE